MSCMCCWTIRKKKSTCVDWVDRKIELERRLEEKEAVRLFKYRDVNLLTNEEGVLRRFQEQGWCAEQ